MTIKRRDFIKVGLAAACLTETGKAEGAGQEENNQVGCLVDTTLCIGCRQCEDACNRRNKLARPSAPFNDRTIFRRERRPTEQAFTVVNEYPGSPSPDLANLEQTYCKVQCMHCLHPACVSACIVGALTRTRDGAVVYNREICLGCRYCMVACPFQVPAYEYGDPLTPRVRKCEFCTETNGKTGANPACAAACPAEALVFGKRSELLTLAGERIKTRPDRYLPHIYGENEVGGTSWLYLTGRPGAEIHLLNLPDNAPPLRTESIQHGIFRYGIIPIAVYGLLGGIMWRNVHKEAASSTETAQDTTAKTKDRG